MIDVRLIPKLFAYFAKDDLPQLQMESAKLLDVMLLKGTNAQLETILDSKVYLKILNLLKSSNGCSGFCKILFLMTFIKNNN